MRQQGEFPRSAYLGTSARFVVAALLVIVLTAGATATAGLLNVQSFVDDLKSGGTIRNLGNTITRAEVGKPRTMLLIGSDHRFGDPGTDARSDTMILLRIDPDAPATTVLSIPRDLRVTFRDRRGNLYSSSKINNTYTYGGEALTAKVIRDKFGIEINDVVNINFRGFTRVIDAIGCVYVDVDHRYYHSNAGAVEQYSEIDLMPGYQLMCGERALSYVRYRHLDTDLVRSARQQDFLRELRGQYGTDDFINDPHKLTKVLGNHIQADKNLLTVSSLIDLGKQIVFSAGKPIQQIAMDPIYDRDLVTGESFVESTPAEIARVRHEFLHPVAAPKPPARAKPKPGKRKGRGRGRAAAPPATATGNDGLYDMLESGRAQAQQMGKVRIPVYVPRWLPSATGYMVDLFNEGGYPHKYRMHAADGKMKAAYRLVVDISTEATPGNYVGVQGLAWTDPPILANPSSDHRTINGRRLDLYYNGKKLQLVACRTPRAVYWISNSLQDLLSNEQMLRMAGSLTRVGGQ
ncbi:MAG TPA: LCP family protein [Conexibacter sp.]|jgi:LCP family protein required for cell wall assembly